MATPRVANTKKYDSYREAWRRIKAAQQAGFYLEAVVIEESIISDRLISYLSSPASSRRLEKKSKGRWPDFFQLIEHLKQEFPSGVAVKSPPSKTMVATEIPNLAHALDDWRKTRNAAVHAIAKSDPGTPTDEVQEFIRKAKAAAERGELLARAVLTWHRHAKRLSARERRTTPTG